MSFAQTARELRSRTDSTQQELADAVGIARATYVSLENGRREPKLGELRAISEYYEVSVQDLVNGEIPASSEPIPTKIEDKHKQPFALSARSGKSDNDDVLVHPGKVREVLLYLISKIGAKPTVGETVIYKLLYFIDFDYYEKNGKSVTGMTYLHNHYGPTPNHAFKVVTDKMQSENELEIVTTKRFSNKQKKYLPSVSLDLEHLSASELEHINDVIARLGDKNATELTELSHYDTPWRVTEQGEALDYRQVYYRSDITAVTEPDDEL